MTFADICTLHVQYLTSSWRKGKAARFRVVLRGNPETTHAPAKIIELVYSVIPL